MLRERAPAEDPKACLKVGGPRAVVHMGHCGKPRDIPALSAVLRAALVPIVG